MSELARKLAEAEATVEHLKRQIGASSCQDVGHRWKFLGGRNAGCASWCDCSVSVHQCEACGDCDYGDNPEAKQIITDCAKEQDND